MLTVLLPRAFINFSLTKILSSTSLISISYSSIKVNWRVDSVISSQVITKGFSYLHIFDLREGR